MREETRRSECRQFPLSLSHLAPLPARFKAHAAGRHDARVPGHGQPGAARLVNPPRLAPHRPWRSFPDNTHAGPRRVRGAVPPRTAPNPPGADPSRLCRNRVVAHSSAACPPRRQLRPAARPHRNPPTRPTSRTLPSSSLTRCRSPTRPLTSTRRAPTRSTSSGFGTPRAGPRRGPPSPSHRSARSRATRRECAGAGRTAARSRS